MNTKDYIDKYIYKPDSTQYALISRVVKEACEDAYNKGFTDAKINKYGLCEYLKSLEFENNERFYGKKIKVDLNYLK